MTQKEIEPAAVAQIREDLLGQARRMKDTLISELNGGYRSWDAIRKFLKAYIRLMEAHDVLAGYSVVRDPAKGYTSTGG